MRADKRLCFGDIDSFTIQLVGPDLWRLGIEGRDDPSGPWCDGAWLNQVSGEHVRALAEALLASLGVEDARRYTEAL